MLKKVKKSVRYANFLITNAATKYTLFVNVYTGNLADALKRHNGKNLQRFIQIMIQTPHSIVHHIFLAPGGLIIVIQVILMGNTSLVVKWQSIGPIELFLFTQVFIGTQIDLMDLPIL